jgi:hypothetical protein
MDFLNLERLREVLLESETWPVDYMFKFIVPNSDNRVNRVVDLLPKHGRITYNHTKNLKHIAVTCVARMDSADQIIDVTKNALSISGVIAL